MKFALVILYGLLQVQCQHYLYLNPRFLNPTMIGPFRPFSSPLPRFAFISHQPLSADVWYPRYKTFDRHHIKIEKQHIEPRYKGATLRKQVTTQEEKDSSEPRFLFRTGVGYSALAGIFRTYIYTSIITTTIPSVSRCIPSAQFSSGATSVTCLRRKRQIAEFLDALEFDDSDDETIVAQTEIKASPTKPVETTAIAKDSEIQTESARYGSADLSSSQVVNEDIDFTRSKRLFNGFFALTTTTTIYSFVTSPLSRQVNVASAAGNLRCNGANSFGCLICVPVGYGVC